MENSGPSREAVTSFVSNLLKFNRQSQQSFFVMATAALYYVSATLGMGSAPDALCYLPMFDDYSNSVIYDGLSSDTALLIKCAISAECSFNPCLELNQLTSYSNYAEAAALASKGIVAGIVAVGNGYGGKETPPSLYILCIESHMLFQPTQAAAQAEGDIRVSAVTPTPPE